MQRAKDGQYIVNEETFTYTPRFPRPKTLLGAASELENREESLTGRRRESGETLGRRRKPSHDRRLAGERGSEHKHETVCVNITAPCGRRLCYGKGHTATLVELPKQP